jgi:hypothetical protein
MPSKRSVPKSWRIPAIYDVIRIWKSVVRIAVESKVNLPNAFFHGVDERGKVTEPIFVLFATFDTGHR